MKKMSQWTVWMCALAFACVANGEYIRVGDGGGNPDFVEGTWPAGAIVEVLGNIAVGRETSLTIQEGVTVRFAPKASLLVQSSAELVVSGTAERPVRLTSIKDGTGLGGDARDAGISDWDGIIVAGHGSFRHAQVFYGGIATQGLLTVRSGGLVEFRNGQIGHARQNGVLNAGTLVMENSVIVDALTGLYLYPPTGEAESMAQVVNCVIHHTTLGVYQNGGDGRFLNCSISDYRRYGASYLDGDVQFVRCNFHSEQDGSFLTATPMDATGTLEVPPDYVDAEALDFRLSEGSALIDAGYADGAPEQDAWGNPRANVPDVEPTGTPTADGTYPDIGIHEWRPDYTTNDVDVTVKSVTISEATAHPGDPIEVSWVLANNGTDPFEGTWTDTLTFVPEYGAKVRLGWLETTGTLAGGEEMTCTDVFTVPAVADRVWRVRVDANAGKGVFESKGAYDNNAGESEEGVAVTAETLSLASVSTLVLPPGATKVWRLTDLAEGGQSLEISGESDQWSGAGAFWTVPGEGYAWASVRDGTNLWLSIPAAEAETPAYLVLSSTGELTMTLTVRPLADAMNILRLDREEVAISLTTSVTAEGVGLAQGVTGLLQHVESGTMLRTELGGWSDIQRYAIFDLQGAATGAYRFGIADADGTTAWAEAEIEVSEPETGGRLTTDLIFSEDFHPGDVYEGRVFYANTGDADLPMPGLVVEPEYPTDTEISVDPTGPFATNTIVLYGESPSVPACILKPGEHGEAVFYYRAESSLGLFADDAARTAHYLPQSFYLSWQRVRDESAAREEEEQAEQARLANQAPVDSEVVPLVEMGTLAGRLVEEDTDRGLEGIQLIVYSSEVGPKGPVVTEADGAFLFTNLPTSGSFQFYSPDVDVDVETVVTYEEGSREITGFVLEARKGLEIRGRLAGEGGEALGGVVVVVRDGHTQKSTVTAEDGSYVIRGLEDSACTLLIPGAQGNAGILITNVEFDAETGVANCENTMDPGVAWSGRILPLEGQTGPLDGVAIHLQSVSGEFPPESVETDADGAFAFGGLVPGETYQFSVVGDYWESAEATDTIEIPDDTDLEHDLQVRTRPFFRAWPPVGQAPMEVAIEIPKEELIPADVVSWAWDFDGDGEADSTEQWATYTYETGGVYAIQLTLSDAAGTETTYQLENAVELIDAPVFELKNNVICLGETNTEYRFLSAVSNAASFEVVVEQLIEQPGQAIAVGSYLVIDEELEDVPNICRITACSREADIWHLTVAEVEDIFEVVHRFQGFAYPMTADEDEEPNPGPSQRRATPRGQVLKNLYEHGGIRLNLKYTTPSKESFVSYIKYDEDSDLLPSVKLYFSHQFVVSVQLQAKGNCSVPHKTDEKTLWDWNFLHVKICGFSIFNKLETGFWLDGSLVVKGGYDVSFSGEMDIDCQPTLTWQVDLGYDKGKVLTPSMPQLSIDPNKWDIGGNGHAWVYLRAEAHIGVTAKIAGEGDQGNAADLSLWGQAGPVLDVVVSDNQVEADIDWKAEWGTNLKFLTFLGKSLVDIDNPFKDFTFGKVRMPAWNGVGSLSCKDFLPGKSFNFGNFFGALPKFSMPDFGGLKWGDPMARIQALSFPGWKPPKFPGVSFKHGKLPKFSGVKLPAYKEWDWDLPGAFSWNGLTLPDLDFDLEGFVLAVSEGKLPSFPNFHLPDVNGIDFDGVPCFTLPDISVVELALKLSGASMPKFNNISMPKWAKLLGDVLENIPLNGYWDWGDGQRVELAFGRDMDIDKALKQLTGHRYAKHGVYVCELGIAFRYVNAINKHKTFVLNVPDNDWDDDGMPNTWEIAFSADGAGLNPWGADGTEDWDGDGLDNYTEFILGTNPLNPDSDGDEMSDGYEAMYLDGTDGPGLKIWEDDAGEDCDGDDLDNVDEYKARPGGGSPDYGPDVDEWQSLDPTDPDTDDGSVEDGQEVHKDGTDPFKESDDKCKDEKPECGCDEHLVRHEPEEGKHCPTWTCESNKKGDPKCGDCATPVTITDDNGCTRTTCISFHPCPKPPKDPPKVNCKDIEKLGFRYCAACKDGIVQWALSHVTFTIKVKCDPRYPSSLSGVIASLSGVGSGSSGIGGGGGGGGGYGGSGGDPCGKTKRPPPPGKPTPNGNSNNGPGASAVFLPMGDYIDDALDLPVRVGGTTAGLARQLQDNEWTFWEAASRLSLAPGGGVEGAVSAGAGTLGVEWNGSGEPGAVGVLTNEATGVSLASVPTGLWGPWGGETQALIRVEYGVLKGNGSVATNYGELVKAWRAAVEGGNTEKAAELEAAAMQGMVRVTGAEDAEGRRTSYEWNGFGQMKVAHFADGTQESYEYGDGGMMSGKTKRDGMHVGLVHDNYGYLTGLNDYKYDYTYDAGTKTFYAAIRYPDGRVGERWFDADGKIFRHAMNGGLVWDEEAVKADALLAAKPAWPKETMNDAELPVTVEYRSGASEAFTWDGPGYARTGVSEATGEERTWTYDDAGREMSETREGVSLVVERDNAGYVTRERVESATGTEEAEWAWDGAGNASEGRMGGWARTNTYDLAGRVLTAAGADGGTWSFMRDAEGRTTAWTQPDGESGAKAYDGRGRMTWRRSPGGVETWWSHATNGLLTGWSNSVGRKMSYQYDRGERVAKATDEAGEVTTYAYDGAGNWRGVAPELRTFVNDGEGGLVLAVTNGGRVTTAHRLWGSWLLRDVQATDQSWRLERNDEGQVTGLVRAPVSVTATTNHWTYDAAGRLSGRTDATGVSVSRGYDAAGFVAWETNGAGGVRRWMHDGTGRLTGVTDAAGRSSVFAYAPATGTTAATLADGSQLEVRADAWGREIGRTDAAGTDIATERRFDGAVLRKTWTAAGAESAALEATWTRDGDGQVLAQGMTGGLATRYERIGSNRCERTVTEYGAFEAGVVVERDAAGRVSAVVGPDGARAECVYGDDGEVSGWLLPEGSVWFARDLTDRKRTMQLPLGQRVIEHADVAGWVTNVVLSDTDGTVVWSLVLTRDAAGRIVRQGSEALEWDGAERVVSAGGTTYARDAAGNRSGSGWTTEGMDRLTAWPGGTYGYDTNGAVVSRTAGASELTFVRDLAGRVTEIRDGSDALVARFAYDAEGRRLSKEAANGTVTWYLWSSDRLAAELSGEGTVERVYGYWTKEARSPDWVRAGGELYVVLKDGFGAPAALVAVSDGSVTEATAGTVFGEGWSCAAMPVWAGGLIADAETGLMAGPDGRLYDPMTSRWLSPTPGAVEAGENLYAREPASVGAGREFPGLSMLGVAPEYDVMYAFARRCGADEETAAALARAELLLGLEGRSDAAARRWLRTRDEATTAAGLRLLGGVPAGQVVCARKGVESFLKARREVLAVTDELDAYGKLRSAMDLEEAFRLELAWSGLPEDRAAMGAWRGTWGWAGLRPEGPAATERWLALLLQAANGERLSEENLEWLGEAKLLVLSDWVRPVTASLDAEKMRETVGEDMKELRQVLQMWAKECK